MRNSLKFILWLISADIIIIAILFLSGLTGIFSNDKTKQINTAQNTKAESTEITSLETTDKESSSDAEITDDDEQSTGETTSQNTTEQNTTEHFYVLNNTSKVYMRDEASTTGKVISELPADAHGDVISTDGSWTKVTYNGETGYIFSEYIITGASAEEMIKLSKNPKIIINKSCNVRREPDTDSPVIGQAAAGTVYNYIEASSDDLWYAIIMPDGSTCYISTEYAGKTN